MKILSVADIHITLHKKKIPYEWQYNRFKLLFDRLLELESETDITVISGDIFDKKPEPDEICLFLDYANSIKNPTIAIPGNHEATSKGKTFLEHFHKEHAINNDNFYLFTENSRIELMGQGFQLFPYGSVQTNNIPEYIDGDILVTHIRGEVPPHITAEFDFNKLKDWKLILLGDLHFRHKYQEYPAYYPGSPLNTTFDRDEKRDYGVDIIDFNSINDYQVNFKNLNLPKLVRKTASVEQELVEDNYNHVIYEIKGSIDELSKVKNHKLLDKKIAEKPTETSKLELSDLSIVEELEKYLIYIKVENTDKVVNYFKNLGIRE
jgi:DNA repair exonuclease SbcCD nuclease subunit